MLRPLADVLVGLLVALTGLTGNVGWAVVILTALIRLAIHPVTRWSLRTLRGMQTIVPQAEVLRRTLAHDPQRARKEIARLYRDRGINLWAPLLPTVLQVPFLAALFQVFSQRRLFVGQVFLGIPLDAAPCLGTILPDLGCLLHLIRNPFIALLPAAVIVTTYVLQRLSVIDAKQSRLFLPIPFLMGWLSLNVPAVISIYWIISTAIQILEHHAIVRSTLPSSGKPSAPTTGETDGGAAVPGAARGQVETGWKGKANPRSRSQV